MMDEKLRRRPADQPGASPRQAIWDVVRVQAGDFVASKIALLADAHPKTTLDYLTALTASGHLERNGEGPRTRYQLVRDTGHEAPRVKKDGTPSSAGIGTECMWRTMQKLREFSPTDVAHHATTDEITVPVETAKQYCKVLLAAGWLRVLRKARPVRGEQAVYRLIRDTGPRPPMVQRVKAVYDPNTGIVHPTRVPE